MKIALVCPRSPRTHIGGIEELTLELGKQLGKRGHAVSIYTTNSNCAQNICIQDMPLFEFPAFAPGQSYFFSPALYFALRKSDVDIIHCNGYNNLTTLAAVLAKQRGQKLVLMLNSSGSSSAFRKILHQPLDWLTRLLKHKIDCVITTSHSEDSLFKSRLKLGNQNVTLIPPGINLEEIQKIPGTAKSGEVICIARLVENKCIHFLIQGFAQAIAKNKNMHLTLVGSGPFELELRKLCQDLGVLGSVTFWGGIPFQHREQLIRKIKESSCLALLSKYEGNPITVQLALACRVPVLVNNQGVLADYVASSQAIGINPENVQEVADKLTEILAMPQNFVCKKPELLDWEEVAQKIEQVYQKI